MYEEFADISARQLLRAINRNFGKWTSCFVFIGILRSALSYAIVAFAATLSGKLFTATELSLSRSLMYWGIVGAIGGLIWGMAVALKAPKNIREAEEMGLETWKGVGGAGLQFGILLGIVFAILASILPGRPMIGIHPVIIWLLFTITGILIGMTASRSAFKFYLHRVLTEGLD